MQAKTHPARPTVAWFCFALISFGLLATSSPILQQTSAAVAEETGEGGFSVHYKNGKTPEWMAEPQESARQVPDLVIEPVNSYWI